MMGILYVKFSPLWPGAVRAIISLAQNHDDAVWPALQDNLDAMMSQYECHLIGVAATAVDHRVADENKTARKAERLRV